MSEANSVQLKLTTLEDTRKLATALATHTRVPQTIGLQGTLGAGKTQLVRFLGEALGAHAADITSPTYVLLQRYPTTPTIYHFDFYRLEAADQVWDLGIDELYEQPRIVLIEWPDKFPECLPTDYLNVRLEVADGQHRIAYLEAAGPSSSELLQRVVDDPSLRTESN